MQGGDRDKRIHSVLVEVGHEDALPGGSVALVHRIDSRLSRGPDLFHNLPVHGVVAILRIKEIDQKVGLLQGKECLLPDGLPQRMVVAEEDASGVHEAIGIGTLGDGGIMAVAGDSGHVHGDRPVLSQKAIEEGGLADVGASEDGDQRKRRGNVFV